MTKIKKIGIFKGFSKLDDEFYDDLEESMILADMGVETTTQGGRISCAPARKAEKIKDVEGARECMKEILADMMHVGDPALNLNGKPAVDPVHRRQRRGQDHHHRQDRRTR